MRTSIVSFVVVGSVSLVARPVVAAPPGDVPAYCRATSPSTQAQVRCLFTERSAQDRAARTRASVAPDAWARCESGSASWTAMESCLGQAGTPGGATTSAGGAAGASGGGGETPPEPVGETAPGATAAAEPAGPATPPSAIAPSPSTVILGPQGTAASAAAEPNRVTRPVTEAEAERHLKGVLERSGEPAARCTKTQYSGGWVTVCE